MLIGYARVSTADQDASIQADRLRAAGCLLVHTETVSGASRKRPELAEAMRIASRGDTLVVTRIDRLARSVSHLLEIIAALKAKGVGFRTLDQPIDTTSPVGNLTLQILGAVAEFERELIRERTRDGLVKARAARRIGKGLRTTSAVTRARIAAARRQGYLDELEASAHLWMPAVERGRPAKSWAALAAELARVHPDGRWTPTKLERAVRRLAGARMANAELLDGRGRREKQAGVIAVIGRWLHDDPALTLGAIRDRLHASGFPTPRGGRPHLWQVSSVGELVRRARLQGVAPARPGKAATAPGSDGSQSP